MRHIDAVAGGPTNAAVPTAPDPAAFARTAPGSRAAPTSAFAPLPPLGIDDGSIRENGRECERHGLVEATLARERYASVLELGCGGGALGRLLVERADRYTGMDVDPAALVAARCRTRSGSPMRFLPLSLPFVPPPGRHELAVLSDLLSVLDPDAVGNLARTLADHDACGEIVVVGARDEHDTGRDGGLDAFAGALGAGFAHREIARRRRYRIDAFRRTSR